MTHLDRLLHALDREEPLQVTETREAGDAYSRSCRWPMWEADTPAADRKFCAAPPVEAKGDLRTGDLLPVLRRASHDDLRLIVKALDRSSDVRIKADERYRAAHDLTAIPDVLAHYVTRVGGYAVVNWCCGGGPSYSDVVREVCGVMRVKVPQDTSLLAMEEQLLREVMERVWEAMKPEERKEAVRAAEEQWRAAGRQFDQAQRANLWLLPFDALGAQIGLKLAGFIVYRVAAQVANLAARQVLNTGLSFAANAALTRGIALVIGPVGWVVSAAWLAVDVLGPSYRGLAPAILHVAALRQRFLWEDDEEADPA